MRILAFTDIHGSYGAVEKILAAESAYDAVILGGDITTMGTAQETQDALVRLRSFGRPLLIVAGNMDPPDLQKVFDLDPGYVDGRGQIMGDVGFFGVSAAPFSPLHTPNEISEEAIARKAAAGWHEVRGALWKVFVPHAPPAQTKLDLLRSGIHVGSTAVREFIEQHAPHVTVCGHIHESRGVDVLAGTTIVNCGPAHQGCYAVVTVGEGVRVELRG